MDPQPDDAAEPAGYVVEVAPGERIHFLDWGGSGEADGVLLVHGLSSTAWSWTAVARRLRRSRPTVALDLRGHGLSDAPTDAYLPAVLAGDVAAVAEGSGLLATGDDEPAGAARRIVLAGHGFGGIVAAWAAAELGSALRRARPRRWRLAGHRDGDGPDPGRVQP